MSRPLRVGVLCVDGVEPGGAVLRTLLWSAGGVLVVVYGAVCALTYFRQRSMLYYPTPPSAQRDVPVLWVESQGERIKVWVVGARAGDPAAPALLYFGGNAEDVAANVDEFGRAFSQHVVYFVNYRGYGGSTGSPSERGLFADGEAIFDAVRQRHSAGSIAVMGRSLGSGVAVHVAATRPVERLVLVTPYDSMVNVAREHFGWLPVGLLVRDRFESVERVRCGEVAAPTLIVIASKDEVVPARRGEALAAAFPPGQAQTLRLKGAAHNSIDLFPQYLQAVVAFLAGGGR